MIKGLDISFWQEYIDFNALADDGIKFVIPRCGYARTDDVRFNEYVNLARNAGVEVPAIYLFSYALSDEDAIKEAEFAVYKAEQAGLSKKCVIFYDYEYDSVRYAHEKGVYPTAHTVSNYADLFCSRVEELGYRAGIYTNIDYYCNWFTDHSLFDKYVMWLADLNGGPDYDCSVQQHTFSYYVGDKVFDGDYWLDEDLYYSIINDTESSSSTIVRGTDGDTLVNVAREYLGVSEGDPKFYEILDIYNGHEPLARGYAIQPDDEWCDAFVSAMAIKAGLVDLIGTEVGCDKHIEIFKQKGIWCEDGTIIPNTGDIILYNWDSSTQPNDGGSDHIGIVESYDAVFNTIKVIEGNRNSKVSERIIDVGWGYIRGYAQPKYQVYEYSDTSASDANTDTKYSMYELVNQVINGCWGNGDERKKLLESAGYNYQEVQNAVNDKLLGNGVSNEKSLSDMAYEVLAGKWGNGDERKHRLESAGYDYHAIQATVNEICQNEMLNTIAHQVIDGVWGNGDERKERLESAGYDYYQIQALVNQIMWS